MALQLFERLKCQSVIAHDARFLPDIVIPQRVYKDISSKELFEEFCKQLKSHKLPSSYLDSTPWTKIITLTFREMGQKLGYKTYDKAVNGEFLTLDQTWRIDEDTLVKTFLAMEVENTDDVSVVLDDELEKLMDVKSDLKVLIYYPEIFNQREHLDRINAKIKSGIRLPTERYVIIMINSDADAKTGSYKKLSVDGFEIKSDSETQFCHTVEIPYS